MPNATCSIEGCDRPSRARGWCKLHYRRWETFGDAYAQPKGYRKRYAVLERDEQGRKFCGNCSQWLPESDYYGHKTTADRLSPTCKTCARVYDIGRKYGMTDAEYRAMLRAQDYRCAICRDPFDPDSTKTMAVDHDHACCSGDKSCGKCVRAVLCSRCNTGLGLFKEDPARLTAAIAYLARVA